MGEEIIQVGKSFCQLPDKARQMVRAEKDLEDLVQLLVTVCRMPFGAMQLEGKGGLWFKAQVGKAAFAEGLPDLQLLHKGHFSGDLLLIENVGREEAFRQLWTNKKNPMRFYAGILLRTHKGAPAGTLWVADQKQRGLSSEQAFAFRTIARQVENILELCPEKERQKKSYCPEKVVPLSSGQVNNFPEEKKILLVEDNRVNQLVTSELLQKWGFKTRIARSGEEALQLAKGQPYDLVLMNLHLPGMDGYAAATLIRALDKHYSRIPILALSTSNPGLAQVKEQQNAFTDALVKPFKPKNLYNKIHKNLYTDQSGSGINPLQKKVDEITLGDEDFKKQLLPLYLQSFREIIEELNAGKLLDAAHLRHVRHKHKATFKMLGLDMLESSMLRLQEQVDKGNAGSGNKLVLADLIVEINQLGQLTIGQLESIV